MSQAVWQVVRSFMGVMASMFLTGFSFGVPYNSGNLWRARETFWVCGALLLCCSLVLLIIMALNVRNDPSLMGWDRARVSEEEDDQVSI